MNGDAVGYLLANLNRIYEGLKFADQKAGVLIAANSALLALTDKLLDVKTSTPLRVSAFIGAVGLIIGAAFAFWAIIPRGGRLISKRGLGVVDSVRSNAYQDVDTFLDASANSSQDSVIKEL